MVFLALQKLAILYALILAFSATASLAQTADLAGLWQGRATLDEVSAPGSSASLPAAGHFPLTVLIHVNSAGEVILLKEVVIVPDTAQTRLLTEPARHVAYLRGLDPTVLALSQRLHSVSFDFDAPVLPLSGAFVPGATLVGRVIMTPQSRSHPFAHRAHPDHDNLDDSTGAPITDPARAEIPTLIRDLRLTLDPRPESASAQTTDQILARYEEVITGLAATPITTRGILVLSRIDDTARIE